MIEVEDLYLINGDDLTLTLYDTKGLGYVEISASNGSWRVHGREKVTLTTRVCPEEWPELKPLTRLERLKLRWRTFKDCFYFQDV